MKYEKPIIETRVNIKAKLREVFGRTPTNKEDR